MNIDILLPNSEMDVNEAFGRAVNHVRKCNGWKLTLKAGRGKKKYIYRNARW